MAEVLFRDGKRNVAPHLAELMSQLDTYKMTYDEAVTAANRKLMSDYLNKTQSRITSTHFRGGS